MRFRSIIEKYAAAALALIAVIALALFLPAHLQSGKAGQRAEAAAEGLNAYDYVLTFRPEDSALDVSLTLDFTNPTGDALNDLVLRTWAGAYQSEETSPAASDALYAACYPAGFSPGGITLLGVAWNGSPVDAAFDDDACTVLRVPLPVLPDGDSGTLTLQCTLTVPECAHRFGHASGVWQFGNALPILSVYEDGAWRTDAYCAIGDPFVSECANYRVTLNAPAGYQCAATGLCRQEKTAEGLRFTCTASAVRDFAFALSDGWHLATARVNGVTVLAYGPTAKSASRAAKYASQALRADAALFGDYAYAQFTLCAVDFPFGGMEYPGLVFLGQSYFEEAAASTLELLIAHEAAHQWFYALVGSDQFNHPWQDEALCEYAVLCYARRQYGQSAYDNLRVTRAEAPMRERIPERVTPGSPLSYFGSLDVYTTVVYGRGAAFLLAVEEMTGQLDAFLRAYCDTFAFRLASRADFAAFLNDFTGEDLTPLMVDYLDTLM